MKIINIDMIQKVNKLLMSLHLNKFYILELYLHRIFHKRFIVENLLFRTCSLCQRI